MQGGHGERFRPLGFLFTHKEQDSGYESEVSVSETLSLGYRLDNLLAFLRTLFGNLLALPIAWCCGHGSVESFRKHKLRRVQQGTETVVQLQKKYRNRFLDIYFQICSFLAEEEWYLLVLPMLIWNVDHEFGRRMTLVVCFGLLIGNFTKDIFRLPRPAKGVVWRPKSGEAMDSTNLADFGFPSTHTMNGISNSMFCLIHYPSLLQDPTMVLFALLFACSVTLSRLYLGAHTPTDIRGGTVVGLIVAIGSTRSGAFEEMYLALPGFHATVMSCVICFLLLNPQPKPRTPTFEQNSFICGLIYGCMFGTRTLLSLGAVSSSLVSNDAGVLLTFGDASFAVNSPVAGHVYDFMNSTNVIVVKIVRTVIGYSFVLTMRVIAKTVLGRLMSLAGLRLKPKIVELKPIAGGKKEGTTPQSGRNNTANVKVKHIRLLTRDRDRVATAVVKFITYTTIAFNIAFTVPVIFHVLGMADR